MQILLTEQEYNSLQKAAKASLDCPDKKKLQELAIARTEASRWDGRRVYENKIMPYPIAGYPAVAAPAPAKQ